MSGQPADNPYAAPQAELQSTDLPQAFPAYDTPATASVSFNLTGTWIVIFCLNIPVAALLGFILCRGLGALGLATGVALLLWLTTYLFRQTGRFSKYWIVGAVCVGVSQFLPYLHLFLGGFAVSLFDGPGDELGFFPAMICTLIVGGGLLGVSLVLALVFYQLFGTDQR